MSRFQSKPCQHCGETMSLRTGTWDTWNAVAEMFLPHQCDGVKAAHQAEADARMAEIIPAWLDAMHDWDDRYGG